MAFSLGVIADDYTGATDIAVTLVKEGMRVVQVIGVPADDLDLADDVDAVVVALKSRTIPAREAVRLSLDSCRWLRDRGAAQMFFKYCSTFDSTPQGNIGPVADALLDALDAPIAFVCPAFPVNERSVYAGYLFVGQALLSESPMRDHPLTPMLDSNLIRLMEAQSAHRAGLIPRSVVARGAEAVAAQAVRLSAEGRRYAVVDAIDDGDLRTIGRAAAGMALVTGGSGVAMGLPANFGFTAGSRTGTLDVPGRSAVLAGSCSAATRRQIDAVRDRWPGLRLDPHRIASGDPVSAEAVDWAANCDGIPVIYASADPDEVAEVQARYGRDAAGQMIEAAFADIARRLARRGFRRFVVAGGETSGAVLDGLGVSALEICDEIAPGVPWTTTRDGRYALALKSGNFGRPDFFEHAFEVLK